jgi:hypothetical protein
MSLFALNIHQSRHLTQQLQQPELPLSSRHSVAKAHPSPSPGIPDGSFNSIPLFFKKEPIHSTFRCLGENFLSDAWKYRSCYFRNLCLDTQQKVFVIFLSSEQIAFDKLASKRDQLTHLATSGNLTVSLGGINPKWFGKSIRLEWFPRIVEEDLVGGYYELPPDSVWIPYHSFAGYNAGHLFWDDFFPIFKLLSLFNLISRDDGIEEKELTLVLTYLEFKLWGTCDWNPKQTPKCARAFAKFLPVMGITNETLSSLNKTRFVTTDAPKSKYVCSPQGLAGIGTLTDHGLKAHGWDPGDYEITHNSGQGLLFFNFRNFMLRNLGLPLNSISGPPYKIILSRFSSSTKGRVKSFAKQQNRLKQVFDKNYVQVENIYMSQRSIREQAEVTSDAAIFVTTVGGGAMTATFLPQGATLIAYYEATGGRKRNQDTGRPARLDWDMLNHASHIKVHWLPVEHLDDEDELNFFIELVRHDLHLISHRDM